MKITVQFFSFLRQLVGRNEVTLDLPTGATVAELLGELYARHPRLREAAQMKGEVDVLGSQNHLEVWNHQRFLNHLENNPMTPDDATTLSDLGI